MNTYPIKYPNIIKNFIKIVQLDCKSTNERLVADYMISKLAEMGFDIFEDDAAKKVEGNTGNIIAFLKGELPGCIMLSAHLDRVDRGYGIKPQIKNGKIYSDGTTILAADNVSGLVVIIDALDQLIHSGIKHSSIQVVLTVCEEKGILGARFLDPKYIKSDMCFIFDSTGPIGNVDLKRPFKAMIEISVHGIDAHGSTPEKGLNAIMAAAHMIDGMQEGRIDHETTSNLGIFHGGNVEPNTVCDLVKIKCEVRSHNKEKLHKYAQYFEEYINSRKIDERIRIDYSSNVQHENINLSKNDEIVKIVETAMKAVDIKPNFNEIMEGCDGNIFHQKTGIPCISLCMGNSNAHTLSESVDIRELTLSGKLAFKIIEVFSSRYS